MINQRLDYTIIASWSCKWFQGFGCSPRKAVHDLSLERRETVWSLSTVGVKKLKRLNPSTRGPGKVNLWCVDCYTNSIVE